MRKNLTKEKLKRGEPAIGTWMGLSDSLSAEVLANMGFDWLTIDMEHNPIDFGDLLHILQAISSTNTTPFVRVPWNDPQAIKRVLDCTAYGIVVPNVKNGEEAKRAVGACRYPPVGYRGVGGARHRIYGGPDYMEKANDEISVHLMIEDVEAVKRADEIMSVPGVDAIFIGPNDLAYSMGVPGGYDNKHPDHMAACKHVLTTGKRLGVPVGIHCSGPEEINRRIEEGYLWMPMISDIRFLQAAVQDALKKIKLPVKK